jgi:hypothetical protein
MFLVFCLKRHSFLIGWWHCWGSLKSLKTGVGSGSVSQRCGSGSAPKCHGSPTLGGGQRCTGTGRGILKEIYRRLINYSMFMSTGARQWLRRSAGVPFSPRLTTPRSSSPCLAGPFRTFSLGCNKILCSNLSQW